MAIDVRCQCGKVYRFDDRDAGTRIRCDTCGYMVTVPLVVSAVSVPPSPGRAPGALPAPPRVSKGVVVGVLVTCAVVLVVSAGLAYHVFVRNLLWSASAPSAPAPIPMAPAPAPQPPTGAEKPAPPDQPAPAPKPAGNPPAPAPAKTPAPPPAKPPQPAPKPTTPTPAPAKAPAPPPAPAKAPPADPLVWAKIILDAELFADGSPWHQAEIVFGVLDELDQFAGADPDAEVFSVGNLETTLTPAALAKKYGPAGIEKVDKGKDAGVTYHVYGPLALGLRAKETSFTQVRAPLRLFQQGFVAAALAALPPPPPPPKPPAPAPAPPAPAPAAK